MKRQNLRKKVSAVMILSLLCSLVSQFNVLAAQNPDFSAINGKIIEIHGSFEDMGFETTQLLDMLKTTSAANTMRGTKQTSYTLTAEQEQMIMNADAVWYTEDSIKELLAEPEGDFATISDAEPEGEVMPLDGSYYDGNPPADAAEQSARMNYIWGVYNKYYSASKYSPNPYLIYLYISHYTENINYDRTAATPNFDQVYAHIISNDDIAAFNTFIQNSQFAGAAATIANMGQAYQVVQSVQNGVALYTKELTEAEEQFSAGVQIVQTMAALEIEKNPNFKISDVAQAYADNCSSATSAEQLINDMNQQLVSSGDLNDLVTEYVDTVQGIMINSAFLSIGPGILDGIFGAAEMLDTAVSVANLAQLYVSYHSRQAARLAIYYGLDPWP